MNITDIFIRYIYGTTLLDKLVKENAAFFTTMRRSWTPHELAEKLKENIASNFSPYTTGTADEQIVLTEIISDVPTHAIATAIYTDFYNKTMIYRMGQGDLVIDVNTELQAAYDQTEDEFYNNPNLNYK